MGSCNLTSAKMFLLLSCLAVSLPFHLPWCYHNDNHHHINHHNRIHFHNHHSVHHNHSNNHHNHDLLHPHHHSSSRLEAHLQHRVRPMHQESPACSRSPGRAR